MIEAELNNLIKKLNISADQILREYAEMIFLNILAKDKISAKLAFYGGTALRLAYDSPRFSENIDLIVIKQIKFLEFKDFIKLAVKENSNWILKDIKDKRQTMFAFILIKEDKLKHAFSLKIELHKPHRQVKLATELLLIKSPTSIFQPLLLVPKLENMRELKEVALINRRKARDIFDLWYISRVLKENFVLPEIVPKFNQREFKNELQVFLPRKYYAIINQLYEKIDQ